MIVSADTQAEAKQLMASAISAHSGKTATRQTRERLYGIFIEAPAELPADDPRQPLITDAANPTFLGFDEDRRQTEPDGGPMS